MAKICFVSNSAWSIYNFRLDVARDLLRAGHELLVMAAHDEYAQLLEDEGCIFVPLHFNNRTENPVADFRLYGELKRLYAQHRPAIIFHYVIKPNIYGSLAAAALDIPSVAVITGLGYGFTKLNLRYLLIRMLYTVALKKTAEVWFLNNEDANFFIGHNMVGVEKTRVLHGEGINTGYFSPPVKDPAMTERRKFRFLMSTRLLKSKGVAIYAAAARMLKKKNFPVEFLLIGFYEQHHPDSIRKEEIDRWQQEGLISYLGFARDVREHLADADCFVFPSYYKEGVPRCLMEAASMHLPVITADNRGCREVVADSVTGYLCDMQNPYDLADKMEKMISLSGGERKQMGVNGRLLVKQRFSIDRIIGLYHDAISTRLK